MKHPRHPSEQSWRARAVYVLCGFFVGATLAADPAPTAKPLLWRIEGGAPSYLFGTVHLPDARVVALPEVVQRAFDGADALFTEIPLDAATQMSMMDKIMLPADQDLKTLVGDELFSRLLRAFTTALGKEIPPATVEALGAQLSRMKPWAAMAQLELLDYLPDLMAGTQPLDMMLYARATAQGKQTGGLETVDEQVACFEVLTPTEQIRLLESSLDELDEARSRGASRAKELVEVYLRGDPRELVQELTRYMEHERELKTKFLAKLLTERNVLLAERIVAKRAASPGKSSFFAVGALHLAGPDGIPALLAKKGVRTTRLTTVEVEAAAPLAAPAAR